MLRAMRRWIAGLAVWASATVCRADEARPPWFPPTAAALLAEAERVRETNRRLDALAELLRHTDAPPVLAGLGLPAEDTQDAWGEPFGYEAGPEGVRLWSKRAGAERLVPRRAPRECSPLPDERILDAAEMQAALNDTSLLMRQCRVIPILEAGRFAGVKLAGIRRDSLAARAGLCNGDVLLAVDDREPATPDAALEILGQLRAARDVRLRLRRGGAEGTLTVRW